LNCVDQNVVTALLALVCGSKVVLSENEWILLRKVARINQLSGYIWHLHKDENFIPPAILGLFRQDYRIQAALTVFSEEFFDDVQQVLQSAKVKFIPVKGSVFRYFLYSDPAVRPAVDVDVLVPCEQFEVAHQALLDAGFIIKPKDERRPVTVSQNYERSYTRKGAKTPGSWLDLHSGFSQSARYSGDYQPVWKRALTLDEFTQRIGLPSQLRTPFTDEDLFLTPEDALVHQFVHNAMHAFDVPLRSLLDVKLLVEKWEPKWEQVVAISRYWKLATSAYLTLSLAKIMLAAEIPEDVLKSLKPSWLKEKWLNLFIVRKPAGLDVKHDVRLGFFRFSRTRAVQQALIGLPLIDGLFGPIHYGLSHAYLRLQDFLAAKK
jgi:hypothetical protein